MSTSINQHHRHADLRMDRAQAIANAAAYLEDFVRAIPSSKKRADALVHIENLHNIAIALAGDRVDEIYGGNEEAICPAMMNVIAQRQQQQVAVPA